MSQSNLLEDFQVVVHIPVAWGDMDAFQHVNNTRMFRYFEDARIAYFERTGIAAASGMPEGIGPILAATQARFKAPLSYPDEVSVGARVVKVGRDRFTMEYKVVSVALGCVVAEGSAVIVAYDYPNERKAPIPEAWRTSLSKVEKCEWAVPEE